MDTAGQEVGKIEKRLRHLGTKLDKLVAAADQVGAEVKDDFRKQIDHIKERRAEVESKLSAFKGAGGQKWDNFKAGIELAWQELDKAIKALKE